MKKILFAIFLLYTSTCVVFSQNIQEKTILYLVPFFTERISEVNLTKITTDDDIYAITPFQLVAFWEGAKLAIEEFENDSIQLIVLVRDITDDSLKLKTILENEDLMSRVDLIIGPFFSSMFEIAARYAKQYQTPIVNPFSTRDQFLKDNEYVFKLMPAIDAAPRLLTQYRKQIDTTITFFLWAENFENAEVANYERYFRENETPFEKVKFDFGISNLKAQLLSSKHNVIVVSAQTQARLIANFRQLNGAKNMPDFMIIVPETWLEKNQAEIDVFNQLNIHFFSDYFVDYKDDKTMYFVSEFIERYGSPPDLSRFSFQGYDITKYFLDCLLYDFDLSKVTIDPVSFGFDFLKRENGGYENQEKRLLMLQDFEIKEVKESKDLH